LFQSHIAEEAKNPSHIVPRAITWALGFTYVAGFFFNLILVVCEGDESVLMANVVAQPVVQLFYNVTGREGAIFFTVMAFLVMNFVCITAMQAGARTVWAFSRDSLLPGSRVWYKIWSRTATPVLAVWLYVLLNILINLIALASYTAVGAIFNTCAIALVSQPNLRIR
jgi:amino acid transporter